MARPLASTLPVDLRLLLPLLILSAFLTQFKLIPGMANNLGPFEVLGAMVILGFLLRLGGDPFRVDPLFRGLAAITGLTIFSLAWIAADRRFFGTVQVAIMIFFLLFLVAIQNLCLRYRFSPHYVLRWTVTSLLIVGPWIAFQGGGDGIQASGPFRNRAHMGSYMLTAFWLALILALWPNVSKRLRYASYLAVGFSLFAVAVSGRRSVYLSLFVGLIGLALSFPGASRGRRLKMLLAVAAIIGFLGGLYFFGGDISPRLAFFQERVGMVGDRLQAALAVGDARTDNSFFALQREGVWQAVRARPVLGIGWGGFAKSVYSPTGHEVHSTPLRFLAELGIVGLGLYMVFMAQLVARTGLLYLRMRQTPFAAAYLAMTLALGSLTISYAYNRHVTERTFWLLLVVLLTMDAFSRSWLTHEAAGRASEQPSPARQATRPLTGLPLGDGRAARWLTEPPRPPEPL